MERQRCPGARGLLLSCLSMQYSGAQRAHLKQHRADDVGLRCLSPSAASTGPVQPGAEHLAAR